MKKIGSVIIITLALNFLALAGGVGWLAQQGRVNRHAIQGIREILFPKPEAPAATTAPSAENAPTTQPMLRLEALLAKESGRSADTQVDDIQHNFDTQMAVLDRRQRELGDLQRQVELSKLEIGKQRAVLDADAKALKAQQIESARLAGDQGFQDSLELYKVMPAKQVKTIFMTLDDATLVHYIEAMEPKTASKIIKEFKTTEESDRIQKVLERMRLAKAAEQAQEAARLPGGSQTQASSKE